MRRTIAWWVENWDTVALWFGVALMAYIVGGWLGAIDDTIRAIRAGY